MDISPETIDQVLSMVLDELGRDGEPFAAPATDGLYDTIDEAVTSAVEAQRRLIAMTLETRHKIIEAIRAAALANNETMSALAVRETTLGRYEDKLRENILCATKTPGTEDISPQAVTGDHGLMLLEFAPVGVIGALTPITNPTGTLIHNSISMIAAGNAVVFNPHPSARETSALVIGVIHRAVVDAGGPPGLIASVRQPTLATAKELMEHPKVNMLVVTGGRDGGQGRPAVREEGHRRRRRQPSRARRRDRAPAQRGSVDHRRRQPQQQHLLHEREGDHRRRRGGLLAHQVHARRPAGPTCSTGRRPTG